MAITQTYVDYGAGDDTTGDGSVGAPWKTLQHAFDNLTRNTTDGNQVNLKAGTAHVNSASLDLTTFIAGGALSATGPLIIRGYTTAAADGGIGEIDCGGATMFAATTYDHVKLVDLEILTFGDNDGIHLDVECALIRCEIHKGASSPSHKVLARVGNSSLVAGCHFHDSGAGIDICLGLDASCFVTGNYFEPTGYRAVYASFPGTVIAGNVFLGTSTNFQPVLYDGSGPIFVIGNAAYNTTAGAQTAFNLGNFTGRYGGMVMNNIVVGQSGTGGDGIGSSAAATSPTMVGHNAFYNNSNNYSWSDIVFIDETAGDVQLLADPFTDAANGDFSLTAAAKTALAAKGWPTSYLGAAAGTVPNLNIGPIQLAADSGGGTTLIRRYSLVRR